MQIIQGNTRFIGDRIDLSGFYSLQCFWQENYIIGGSVVLLGFDGYHTSIGVQNLKREF